MMKRYITFLLFLSILFPQVTNPNDPNLKAINDIFGLISNDLESFSQVEENFNIASAAMLLETFSFVESTQMQQKIINLLVAKTSVDFGPDINKWYQWLWTQKYTPNPYYAEFKAHLYSYLDPQFKEYFSMQYPHKVRLDEIRWGGVKQDGIPPLNNAKLISSAKADYLNDSDVVYGIFVDGEYRAYPKRIIAWHEILTEQINNTHITGVFCSLCGTMTIYESAIKGRKFSFGTSGFLYRSNKLMYDKETSSLWSTYYGEPVVGIMVGRGLKLKKIPVVMTTWGEWKLRHPSTKVLDVNTDFDRNYNEGEAYKEYFKTDELMFETPFRDDRLPNKANVVTFHMDTTSIAIHQDFLEKNPIYQTDTYLSITVGSETRIFESPQIQIIAIIDHNKLKDSQGQIWIFDETTLRNQDQIFNRISSAPSFWFGWIAAYPKTLLVK